MTDIKKIDVLWDDNPVDITTEANFIWSIANKLRGTYMPDKYGDVIIPMTIIRRFECALAKTKADVVAKFKENPHYPVKAMYKLSGYQFYNVSEFTLQELCNDADHIADNFKAYIQGFSDNIKDILNNLDIETHIDKMSKGGCLFNTVKAFSELDLSVETFDSIKMGYIFENLIGRFFQNVDAGQFYTGRDIIKLGVSLLVSEGCDDIFDDHKLITICDQAAGTGGMLSTAYSYFKHYNPTADVKLFGVEFMGVSWAVGMAEMLIKGQDATNFVHADSFKEDPSAGNPMRFVLMNPPFGTPWSGSDAKAGQAEAVIEEHKKVHSRWGAGLPGGGDSQMLFLQSAIAKLDDKIGRAAIIENGSPLFTGGTSSGESQIRRWLLENDLLEAIVAMPTDLFYNTGIASYWWIISKNKREERKGYVQLIDATNIYHKLRKPVGNKKNEFSAEDRAKIAKLYTDFKKADSEYSKVFTNEDFMYREYAVMQPLQRSYAITEERIEQMLQKGALKNLWDDAKVAELEEHGNALSGKDQNKLDAFYETKSVYELVLAKLQAHISEEKWLSPKAFEPVLTHILGDIVDKKTFAKLMDGLSVMDKTAEIQRDKKGNIIYDKETKDTELVKYTEDIETYMAREVLPHIPDAKWFWEEDLTKKKPVIKTGAEIPFTRYFYKYQAPKPSAELLAEFLEIDKAVNKRIARYDITNKIIAQNTKLKDSGIEWIGEIPEKWNLTKIGMVYLLRNIRVSDKDYPPLSVTKLGVLPQLETVAKTNAHDDRKLVKKGDFAINSRSDRRGSCGISSYDGSVSLINTVLTPKAEMHSGYYNWLFHTTQFADEFYKNGHGIVDDLWTTNWQDMKKIVLPIPEYTEQQMVSVYLDTHCSEINSIIEAKKKEIEILEDYKKSLIYEYVTGKKEVPAQE